MKKKSKSKRSGSGRTRGTNREAGEGIRSTRIGSNGGSGGVRRLDKEWFVGKAAGATRVWILSPFWDADFLMWLIDELTEGQRPAEVRLVFNKSSGRRLHLDKKEIDRVVRKTRKRKGSPSIQVRFFQAPGLFHTKLYGFVGGGRPRWYAGSVNATTAAFERNEEVLVPSDPASSEAYATTVWERAVPMERLETGIARSLPQFFRQGSLYFEPKASLSFSYNGLHCPRDYNRAFGERAGQQLLHRDLEPGRAVRAYSVKRALGLADDPEVDARPRVAIRPYAMETCLGLWVPEAYRDSVNERIEKASRTVRKRLKGVREKLRKTPRNRLLARYREMLGNVEAATRKFNKDCRLLNVEPWTPEPKRALEGYGKFLDRLSARLEDEDLLDRASRKYTDTPMPEIWSDPLSAEEFVRSFFEYAGWSLAQSGTGRTTPAIVRRLAKRAHWTDPDESADDLRLKLETILQTDGWDEDGGLVGKPVARMIVLR